MFVGEGHCNQYPRGRVRSCTLTCTVVHDQNAVGRAGRGCNAHAWASTQSKRIRYKPLHSEALGAQLLADAVTAQREMEADGRATLELTQLVASLRNPDDLIRLPVTDKAVAAELNAWRAARAELQKIESSCSERFITREQDQMIQARRPLQLVVNHVLATDALAFAEFLEQHVVKKCPLPPPSVPVAPPIGNETLEAYKKQQSTLRATWQVEDLLDDHEIIIFEDVKKKRSQFIASFIDCLVSMWRADSVADLKHDAMGAFTPWLIDDKTSEAGLVPSPYLQ